MQDARSCMRQSFRSRMVALCVTMCALLWGAFQSGIFIDSGNSQMTESERTDASLIIRIDSLNTLTTRQRDVIQTIVALFPHVFTGDLQVYITRDTSDPSQVLRVVAPTDVEIVPGRLVIVRALGAGFFGLGVSLDVEKELSEVKVAGRLEVVTP